MCKAGVYSEEGKVLINIEALRRHSILSLSKGSGPKEELNGSSTKALGRW